MTKSLQYFQKKTVTKCAVFFLIFGTSFFYSSTANAVSTGIVSVTCTNGTFQTGWDNSNSYFQGRGNIAALYCDIIHHTGYVSDNLTDPTLRYYQGVLPQDTPTAIVETQTVVAPQDSSTATVPPQPVTSDTPTVPTESETATVPSSDSHTAETGVETSTPIVDSGTVVLVPSETQTGTSESSTQTIPSETSTAGIETPSQTPNEPVASVPSAPPAVEPEPVPQPQPQPAPQPEPQPSPEPEIVPEPQPEPEVTEPEPVVEPEPTPVEPAPEPEPSPEEPTPSEEVTEVPLEVDEPTVEPVDTVVVDTPPTPVEPIPNPVPVHENTVTLDNGVVLTEEEAVAVALLQNPGELLQELFTNPVAALAALGSVGADMSPEVREEAEKVVIASVIAGNIATQAAATAGAVAAYRRKP